MAARSASAVYSYQNDNDTESPVVSVYYDGKCGLCAREISFFRKLSPRKPIQWNDIAHHPELLEGTGLRQSDALMFMRVQDETGVMRSEVDAFIVMWRQFSGWSLLARLVSLPGFYQLTGLAYRRFAAYRFRKYPHCQASLNQ